MIFPPSFKYNGPVDEQAHWLRFGSVQLDVLHRDMNFNQLGQLSRRLVDQATGREVRLWSFRTPIGAFQDVCEIFIPQPVTSVLIESVEVEKEERKVLYTIIAVGEYAGRWDRARVRKYFYPYHGRHFGPNLYLLWDAHNEKLLWGPGDAEEIKECGIEIIGAGAKSFSVKPLGAVDEEGYEDLFDWQPGVPMRAGRLFKAAICFGEGVGGGRVWGFNVNEGTEPIRTISDDTFTDSVTTYIYGSPQFPDYWTSYQIAIHTEESTVVALSLRGVEGEELTAHQWSIDDQILTGNRYGLVGMISQDFESGLETEAGNMFTGRSLEIKSPVGWRSAFRGNETEESSGSYYSGSGPYASSKSWSYGRLNSGVITPIASLPGGVELGWTEGWGWEGQYKAYYSTARTDVFQGSSTIGGVWATDEEEVEGQEGKNDIILQYYFYNYSTIAYPPVEGVGESEYLQQLLWDGVPSNKTRHTHLIAGTHRAVDAEEEGPFNAAVVHEGLTDALTGLVDEYYERIDPMNEQGINNQIDIEIRFFYSDNELEIPD